MWDVSLKVVVVLAVMFACIAPVQGQAAPKAKAKAEARSAFDQLDDSQLMDNLVRFGMHEFVGPLTPKDMTPRSMLIRGGLQAQAMRQITDPAARLAKGGQIIEMMVKALDMAEKEMEDAEAAAEKAPPQTKTAKLLEAAKAAYLFYDIMYFLGDVSGRQAIEPYAGRLMYLQGNREDRKIILKSTKDAIMYLGDMQDELKKKRRVWQEQMAVWMIMGSRGESLLKTAEYWSAQTYLYRAMALGGAEAHETEREGFKGEELDKLIADQKKRTLQRRELFLKVLNLLPQFEKNKRFKVTHDARRLMALAHRELGEYDKAIEELDAQRYQGASPATRLTVAREFAITKIKQGKYTEVPKIISNFKGYAELLFGGGKKLTKIQQAQVDLEVAMLKDYLYRRWAAASTSPTDKTKYHAQGQAAMVEVFEKYNEEGIIRRSFIDFFGNRLLYTQEVDKLSSVQLYIISSGVGARKEPKRRRLMLETLLGRKDDPATRKLAPAAHWELAMVLNELGIQMDAADHFLAFVDLRGPDDPKSPKAAKNAAICMEKYVTWYETTKKRNILRPVRLKCAAAMKRAVSFDKKHPDLKLSDWYYDLGRHCNKLSQGNCPDKEVVVWMERAAEAFSKVPPDHGNFLNAQELWLDLRYRALKLGKMDAKTRADARKLYEQYGQFIQLVEKAIADLQDKTSERAKGLTESAAWADFTRAKLMSEQLDKKVVALVELDASLKKWAVVNSMVVAANQWKIQNLVDQDKIEEASAALDAFLKANEKNPDVGAGLIEQVIEGIRKAIDEAQAKAGNEAKLASLRKSYLQLAERLYAPIKGKPIETDGKVDNERLTLTQLWIDALIQNNRAAEAMTLALECRRIFDKKRDVQAKKIEAKYAPAIRLCKAAVGLPKALTKLVKQYLDESARLSKLHGTSVIDPEEDGRAVRMSHNAMANAPANTPPEKRRRQMQQLSRDLVAGYGEIIRRLKNLIPLELTVEWNVAKCLAATEGKTGAALEIYSRLIRLTDPRTGRESVRRYWRLNLEYCQTFYEAFKDDKKNIGKLAAYIETELPKVGGDALGGFKVQFFAIKEKARRKSK